MNRKLLRKKRPLLWSKLGFFLMFLITCSQLMGQMVHPGVSHTQSDLDRMKLMVEAGEEPWLSSFELLSAQSNSSYDYTVRGDASITTISANDGAFLNDGYAAYRNALMWYITGDERHAQKCVEIFNAWKNLTSTTGIPLSQGRGPWKICEAAEIIKHTYDGWSESDQEAFGAMLVYPGWSGTEVPTGGTTTFYWGIYQGDPARHGNQGLFAYRSLMAMAIFLDNEVMYQRALRYIMGEGHLAEDLPYPSGPPVTVPLGTGNEYYEEYSQVSRSTDIEDYGYNEVMSNYIYENGQCQESSRDQTHTIVGILIMTCISEMAWNQGDDLYGHLDNRQLLGLEFTMRYNLSWEHSYSDQLTPWEPTVESGEYIERFDRSGRWKSLKINPYVGNNLEPENFERGTNTLRPIYEMVLGHYKDRVGLDPDDYKWMQRGFDVLTDEKGVEDGENAVDYPGFGGLKFHRVSSGDPISGFDGDGLPVYSINVLPGTIEAEHFDHFPIDGESLVYHDIDETNTGGAYRLDQGVDVETCDEGGYQLGSIENEEWLTYTVQVPNKSLYNLSIRYASANAGGKIKFSFDGEDFTEEVTVPFGGDDSGGLTDYQDFVVSNGIVLDAGVQQMKISFSGASESFVLNSITLERETAFDCEEGLASTEGSDLLTPGVIYSHYEGDWDNLPDFDLLTPVATEQEAESIGLASGISGDGYGLVYEAYLNVPIDGTYTFYTSSADGSRLFIDEVEVVDNDGVHDELEESGEVCLDEGYHVIRVEYFNKTGDEVLSVMYSGPSIDKQSISDLYFLGPCDNLSVEAPDNLEAGVSYLYYETEVSWSVLPDFSTLTPVAGGNLSAISISSSAAIDGYGFTFEGYIDIAEEGDYTFYTNSDDGSKLYIDDMEVVDNDGAHGAIEEEGSLCLAAGYHKLRVEYFEASGGNSLSVMYEGPNIEKQEITGIMTEPAVEKIVQTITFPALSDKLIGDEDFSPGATTDSGLPLTYTSSNEEIAIIVDDLIQIVSNGVTTITASQEGDWIYATAEDVSHELNVFKVDGCVLPWIMSNVSVKNDSYEFTSEPIDISCVSGATISFTLLGTSSLMDTDYLNIYYQVDEGEQQTVAELNGPLGEDFVIENIEGSSIRLIFEAFSSLEGTYQINNIAVYEYVEPPVLSSNLLNAGVDIYPNPANDAITVNMRNGSFEAYKIFSIHGKLVHENDILPESSKMNVDISMLPKGVYLMKLYGDQTALTLKVIKQ